MAKFLLGLGFGLVLVPVGAYFYLTSGQAPAAATDSPLPFEWKIARAALHAKIAKEMPRTAPLEANEAAYLAGARVYRANCAQCHGLSNHTLPVIAKGMFPECPQLWNKDEMVTDDPPGETFWKVKNGIRLTGMPGFGRALSTDEMWQVSLLLANADKLPASVQAALAAPSGAGETK